MKSERWSTIFLANWINDWFKKNDELAVSNLSIQLLKHFINDRVYRDIIGYWIGYKELKK